MKPPISPPHWARWLLTRLHPNDTLEEVEGDLDELYTYWYQRAGKTQATLRYLLNLVSVLPPLVRRRQRKQQDEYQPLSNLHPAMLRNYLKIAWRNLIKHKAYSFINIFGLTAGMATAMLIGLWTYDELSFDKQAKHYHRLAQLWQFIQVDVEKSANDALPIPLADELRNKYPDFEAVSLSSSLKMVLATGDKKITKNGSYVEPVFTKMFSVNIVAGSSDGLNEVNTILLSESTANAFFGSANPLHKLIKLDNKQAVRVVGVYEDFPANSTFNDVSFLAPWKLLIATDKDAKQAQDQWDSNSFNLFAELKPGADFELVSAKIKDIRMKGDHPPTYKPEFFLHPMSKWHLYADFNDGTNTGGLILFVRLFGIIGSMVLLLACINFMNLSTARSEKRAKEVGIRKAVGSVRRQLIFQFYSESLLMVLLAFVLSILFVQLALPFFNQVADKQVAILWTNPWFWLSGLGFCLLTGLIAGSYPALYLSSFQPVKVLKGAFRTNRFAAVPRKVLVGFQFTVSVTLIIGTLIVFRQIEYAKNRPVGYNRNGLIEIHLNTPELSGQIETMRHDLLQTGAIIDMAQAHGSITEQYNGTTNLSWRGKVPDAHPMLMSNSVTHDYGKTVGWQLVEGRDFSSYFSTDTASMVLNKTAAKLMGFKNPIGELVRRGTKDYKVIGVIQDMIKENPFKPVSPSFFLLTHKPLNVILIKLSPQLPTSEALAKVESVFKIHNPAAPFEFKFVDEAYTRKFGLEERIGKLAGGFAGLAILISCLGLFGLASFVAEQRTKEIGVRKVLGASVTNLWVLLCKDFMVLVIIAISIATPISWYFLNSWLQMYQYHTELSWWIFAVSGLGALVITLLTVSYQSIKAALMNPVKSLRSE